MRGAYARGAWAHSASRPSTAIWRAHDRVPTGSGCRRRGPCRTGRGGSQVERVLSSRLEGVSQGRQAVCRAACCARAQRGNLECPPWTLWYGVPRVPVAHARTYPALVLALHLWGMRDKVLRVGACALPDLPPPALARPRRTRQATRVVALRVWKLAQGRMQRCRRGDGVDRRTLRQRERLAGRRPLKHRWGSCIQPTNTPARRHGGKDAQGLRRYERLRASAFGCGTVDAEAASLRVAW
mmetsp:Transcript_29957/g.77593  ORF Transcript_29957/g.77593 Transcript_29957/m.77593 type:complete len:240 (+) Transcript_29957:2516-3235(+)